MSDIVTIGAVTTTVVSYKNQRVCTSKQLAQLYGTEEIRIQQNHTRNAARFEEGKHFHKVAGQALDDLRLSFSELQISPKARNLILWTDRGAARHAKMLETEKAWDVFEELEDNYFSTSKKRAAIADGKDRSTPQDRIPLYHFVVDTGLRHKLIFSKVYTLINTFAGCVRFAEMTKEQAVEADEFCGRFAKGQETRNDWQRITDNQTKLHGTPPQLDMVQKLLLS